MRPELESIWDRVALPPSVSGTRDSFDYPRDLGPNLEPAYGLGQRLDVDAILMYAMNPHRGNDFMWVYLLWMSVGVLPISGMVRSGIMKGRVKIH